MDLEATAVDVAFMTVDTLMRTLSGVKTFVQFQVHKLGEFSRAEFALIRLLSRVEPQMCLQVACAAESFMANLIRKSNQGHEKQDWNVCVLKR